MLEKNYYWKPTRRISWIPLRNNWKLNNRLNFLQYWVFVSYTCSYTLLTNIKFFFPTTYLLKYLPNNNPKHAMQGKIKRSHFIIVQVLLWESETSRRDGLSVGDFSTVRESLTDRYCGFLSSRNVWKRLHVIVLRAASLRSTFASSL